MTMDQSHERPGREDVPGGAGPEREADPIARNPKDITPLEKAMEKMRIGRNPEIPEPAPSPRVLPGQPVTLPHHVPTAASTADLLVSILRFKWTLVAVFVLVAAPALAAIWTQVVPKYQARAEVRVRPIIPRLVFRTEDNGLIPLYDSFVNTQVSVIRKPTVLQRALDQPKVRETQWYKSPSTTLVQRLRGAVTPPMERLRDDLSVSPRPRTEIIDVTLTAEKAADARVIVDNVLEQYMIYVGEKSDATENDLYVQLTNQYKSLQGEIQKGEKKYADLCTTIGTDTPQELVSGKRVRLDETQARLSELQNQIKLLEWELKQIVPADSNDGSPRPVAKTEKSEQPRYHQDAEWRKLDLSVKTVEQQIADSVYGPTHPEGIRLRKELNFTRDLLRQRQAQLDEQWQDRLKNASATPIAAVDANAPAYQNEPISLERQLARAKHEEQLLVDTVKTQQADFQALFENVQALEKENSALRYTRQLFDAVQERLAQKNIERNVPGSIEVGTQAYSPSRPVGDRRLVFTVMALALALGTGGGAAFLRASRNQVIYSSRDMPQPLQSLLLGHMPLMGGGKPPARLLLNEVAGNQFHVVESIRLLRTALAARLADRSTATVLVTSAGEGTGKSSFVVMLGKSIAQAGGKVLIVDADIHKRSLSQRFDLLGKPGFMEALNGQAVDGLPIYPTDVPGLDIMPAGKGKEDGAVFEGTANGAFKLCTGQLFRQRGYSIVLFDTAPILPVADTAILARQVDGAIIVEREHLSLRTEVVAALSRLSSTGGRLLGTVLVGSSGDEGKRYKYDHYYSKTKKP